MANWEKNGNGKKKQRQNPGKVSVVSAQPYPVKVCIKNPTGTTYFNSLNTEWSRWIHSGRNSKTFLFIYLNNCLEQKKVQ